MNGNSNSSSASNSSDSGSNSSQQSDSRLTVADILSSMANGEVVTPSTFATLEGFSTGIPTRTTPTLTPTTLRNIEQTFIELQSVPPQSNHHHQAGFVPPVVNAATTSSQVTSTYQNIKEDSLWYTTASPSPRSVSSSASSGRGQPTTTTKSSGRMGGRRPNRDEKLSPEEEERRRVRRERNKLAAARCRKRRLDHTNSLLHETDGLEEKKQELRKEIDELQSQKEHLEFILEAHRCLCKNNGNNGKLNGITSHVNNLKEAIAVSSANSPSPLISTYENIDVKPVIRPTSLQIPPNFTVPSSTSLRLNTSVSVSEIAGVPISTPSNGIFNFDALMEGGTGLTPMSTGLTPVVPTCSSQQRNSNCDLASPETLNPPKLVSL